MIAIEKPRGGWVPVVLTVAVACALTACKKDDASEVREGFECGLVLKNFQDIKIGDIVESFEMREIPRS